MSGIDLDALLVALVLSPATYSRNRFFGLYTEPAVRRARRRASSIRGIVRQMARLSPAQRLDVLGAKPADAKRVVLSYEVPELGLRRTATLEPLEFSLVRFSVARIEGAASPFSADDADLGRIQSALHRLGPSFGPAPSPNDEPHAARATSDEGGY